MLHELYNQWQKVSETETQAMLAPTPAFVRLHTSSIRFSMKGAFPKESAETFQKIRELKVIACVSVLWHENMAALASSVNFRQSHSRLKRCE